MRVCQRCGKMNPDGKRYCSFCSADLLSQRSGTHLYGRQIGNLRYLEQDINRSGLHKVLVVVLSAMLTFILVGVLAMGLLKMNEKETIAAESAWDSAVQTAASEYEAEASALLTDFADDTGKEEESAQIQYVVRNASNGGSYNAGRNAAPNRQISASPRSNGFRQYLSPQTTGTVDPGVTTQPPQPDPAQPSQPSVNPASGLRTAAEGGVVFSDSSFRYLADAEVRILSSELLQMAINEIYARNGYLFHSESWRQYYSQFWWYTPTTSDMNEAASRFNVYELANVNLLANERTRRE